MENGKALDSSNLSCPWQGLSRVEISARNFFFFFGELSWMLERDFGFGDELPRVMEVDFLLRRCCGESRIRLLELWESVGGCWVQAVGLTMIVSVGSIGI